jgi:hypothetical protein
VSGQHLLPAEDDQKEKRSIEGHEKEEGLCAGGAGLE